MEKRRTYSLPDRSEELLEVIKKYYGHGSLTSALAACIHSTFININQEAREKLDPQEKLYDDKKNDTNVEANGRHN